MKHSITTKITIIFVIAFSLVCMLFITFGKLQTDMAIDRMKDTQLNAINYLLGTYDRGTPPRDLSSYFKNFGMHIILDAKTVSNVLHNADPVFSQKTQFGEFLSLRYDNSLYLSLKNQSFIMMFESAGIKNINDPLWIGFFLTSTLLISLYISVMKNLNPLKQLNNNIKKFAAGNLDVKCFDFGSKRDDEISQVAYEFDNAVSKIRELIRSRQLFLRAIMHELKTPIGKGRIVSEMIEDETQKNRLVGVFERLEILINEFAKVEQLLSKSYSLNYQECHFSLILEQARDTLMLDNWDSRIKVNMIDDAVIRVDFQLFSLAIKNLIDNALKYATNKKCEITCNVNQICVSNLGDKLPLDILHYKQAFVREKNDKVGGLGLGLYIIEKICDMHKFELDYCHDDGAHYFCIKFDKPAIIKKSKKVGKKEI